MSFPLIVSTDNDQDVAGSGGDQSSDSGLETLWIICRTTLFLELHLDKCLIDWAAFWVTTVFLGQGAVEMCSTSICVFGVSSCSITPPKSLVWTIALATVCIEFLQGSPVFSLHLETYPKVWMVIHPACTSVSCPVFIGQTSDPAQP